MKNRERPEEPNPAEEIHISFDFSSTKICFSSIILIKIQIKMGTTVLIIICTIALLAISFTPAIVYCKKHHQKFFFNN